MKFQQFMERSLLMDLYKQYHHYFSPLSDELKKQGLNLNESLILLAIFFEGSKEVTPSQLTASLRIPKDQVSQSLRKLESMNFIRRQLARDDKRKKLLQTTAAGRKKASQLISVFDSKESRYEKDQETVEIL